MYKTAYKIVWQFQRQSTQTRQGSPIGSTICQNGTHDLFGYSGLNSFIQLFYFYFLQQNFSFYHYIGPCEPVAKEKIQLSIKFRSKGFFSPGATSVLSKKNKNTQARTRRVGLVIKGEWRYMKVRINWSDQLIGSNWIRKANPERPTVGRMLPTVGHA